MANQTININRKKYAVGVFWQPMGVGQGARNYARSLARGVDKKLNEALKEVESGKFDSWNVTEGTWKPSLSKSVWEKWGLKKSAEYKGVIDGKAWDDKIEFVIKNNGVAGIVKDGKTYNQHSKIFQDLKANYPALFDDVMNHQKDFTGNIVRTLV